MENMFISPQRIRSRTELNSEEIATALCEGRGKTEADKGGRRKTYANTEIDKEI